MKFSSLPFLNKGTRIFSEIEFVLFPQSSLKSISLNAFVEGFCLGFLMTVSYMCMSLCNGFHNNSAMLSIRIHVLRHLV